MLSYAKLQSNIALLINRECFIISIKIGTIYETGTIYDRMQFIIMEKENKII